VIPTNDICGRRIALPLEIVLGPGMTEEGARAYVRRIGKPFGEVYDVALSSLISVSSGEDNDDVTRNRLRKRTIMIGDALETDVVGATTQGLTSYGLCKMVFTALMSGRKALTVRWNCLIEKNNALMLW